MTGLFATLNLPQGESYQRFYAFLPRWVLGSLLLAGSAWGVWLLLKPRLPAAWRAGSARITRPAGIALAGLCVLLVAACDGSGLVHGFFRQDDFSFLQVVREPGGVGRQMLLIHNDHLLPLYRLQVWLTAGLAGPDATTEALAGWFRTVTFASCLGLLMAGCWLLHELGGSAAGLLGLAFFTWMWPGWGEFTAGYFTLSAYIQIMALGLAAAAAMLRGSAQGSGRWLALSLLLATAAAGIDVSGVYVFASLALLCVARHGWRNLTPPSRRYLFVLGPLFVAIALFFFLVARHAHTARELVQNPHGTSLSVATLVDNLRQQPLTIALTGLAAPGGLLLNLVTPTFLQLLVVGERVSPAVFRSVLSAELLVLPALVLVARQVWRHLPATDRWLAGALATNALLSLGMVVAARTDFAVHVPVPLWQAKYLVMPTVWVMLTLIFVVDRLWLSRPGPAGLRTPALFYTALVAGVWLTASCWQFEQAVLPRPLAYVPRGRWGNVSNAEERARQYQTVLTDLADIARQQGGDAIVLPAPDRWSASFYSRFSLLEWGSDYTARGVTYLFWDLPAAAPGRHLSGRWAPAAAIPAASRPLFARYAWLEGAFAPPNAAEPDRAPTGPGTF